MPAITWGPQLELGINIIDTQHKRLVDIINDLHDGVEAGRTEEIIGTTFDELVDYTHTHFRCEEKLLLAHEYENYDAHVREHKIFTDQIEMYRDRYLAGAISVAGVVMDYLRDWLLGHIARTDRAYARTLKEAGVE